MKLHLLAFVVHLIPATVTTMPQRTHAPRDSLDLTLQTSTTNDAKWDTAVAVGGKLQTCMLRSDRAASWFFRTDPTSPDPNLQTIQSPFDGDMVDTFKKWGYNKAAEVQARIDKECDFDAYHHIKPAFEALGIGTKARGNGGPNWCVQVDHHDGPAVLRDPGGRMPPVEEQRYVDESCGKVYRVTGGTFQFGINADAGMITLINVISPAYSANRLWGRKPATYELPHIRSISDVAWGLWNRASPGNVKNIKYLMTAMVMNDETRSIIRQAHETMDPKRTETMKWPGSDFVLEDDVNKVAGRALLGSPVGRWVAYFLMQHKKQLGGNKYISKIRVFKPESGFMPFMLFYVSGPGPAQPEQDEHTSILRAMGEIHSNPGQQNEDFGRHARVVGSRRDSKHVVTEHIVRARL